MFKKSLLTCGLLVFLSLAACNPRGTTDEPAVTATPEPAPTAVPTDTPEPAEPTPSAEELAAAYVQVLQNAVTSGDLNAMQSYMSNPVLVAPWRSEGRAIDPAQMVAEFENNALPAPTAVQFTGLTEAELTGILGQPPASILGPDANVVAILHSTGWGVDGTDEAILYVTGENGVFNWTAFLYNFGPFAEGEMESGTGELQPFVETDVEFVQAQQDVTMYAGPGPQFGEISFVADGQTARVTGQSEDGAWWRVICPDDTIGDCWISADPTMTVPQGGSLANPGRLISADPVFTGGDLQFSGWSPDGRYLAYFEYTEEQVAEAPAEGLRGSYPGTFVFYDTETDEKCTDYPYSGLFGYEGGEAGRPWRFLPDGRLLLSLPEGELLLTDAPCEPGENIEGLFDTPITAIGSISPDGEKLILLGTSYYIFDLASQAVTPIAEVQPDAFNNVAWSPDGQHLSIALAGNYTGDRSPIGGSRVVDANTGSIIARYDWEPANALDGSFGGPVWVTNDAFVITLTLDQGPFLMTVDGDVTPLLPLFDETFDPDNYWPPLDVYADVENDRYAILRGNEGREGPAKLLTVDSEGQFVVELDPASSTFRIFPDGSLAYEDGGHFWARPIFEADAEFVQQPSFYNPWNATGDNLVTTTNGGTISIYDLEQAELVDRILLEGYESGFNIGPIVSPDDRWLAVFVQDRQYGLGKALFVLPAPGS